MSQTTLEMLEIIEEGPASGFESARGRDQGFGALRTSRGNLPLRAMDVQGRIDALIAQVTLSQTFVNPFDVPIEATYVFPLPDMAAVTEFRMEVADRVIEGVLKERGEARRDYRQAIQAGKRAALAEEDRPDVFTMTVGNLMPGESATVRLLMTQPLPYSDGEATFRFPLVVGERYIPGSPLPGDSVGSGSALDTNATPDASRVTPARLLPGFPNPVRLNIEVTWNFAGLRAQALRSSLHAVRIHGDVEGEEEFRAARIQLGAGERLDRDFILRAKLASDSIQTSLLSVPDEDGEHETFLLTILPPESSTAQRKPRDLVFLIDRSGSMEGWRIVAARRALERIIQTLTERDRFNVIVFDDQVEVPPPLKRKELKPASYAARAQVCRYLSGLRTRGGTEMAEPLFEAAEMLAGGGSSERDSVLTLITDGEVGNEDQLLKTIGKKAERFRIFSLGIGSTLNMGLLQRLSALGGGHCETVESEQRLEESMDRIHRQIGSPVLRDLRLFCDGLEADAVVPGRLPDLFDGIPLVISGRVRRGSLRFTVMGTEDAPDDMAVEMKFDQVGGKAIRAIWARGQIRKLEDRLAAGQRSMELERLITETSLRFGVLSRFTAFVAVDHSRIVNPGGETHKVAQPVEATQQNVFKFQGRTRSAPARSAAPKASMPAPPASASFRSRPGLPDPNDFAPPSFEEDDMDSAMRFSIPRSMPMAAPLDHDDVDLDSDDISACELPTMDMECASDEYQAMPASAAPAPPSAMPTAKRSSGFLSKLFGAVDGLKGKAAAKPKGKPPFTSRPTPGSQPPPPSSPSGRALVSPWADLFDTPGLTAILMVDHNRILIEIRGRIERWVPPTPLSAKDLAQGLVEIAACHGFKIPSAMNASGWRKRGEPTIPAIDWSVNGVALIALPQTPEVAALLPANADLTKLIAAVSAAGGIASFAKACGRTPGGLAARIVEELKP